MNTRKLVCVTTMTLVAALAITIPLSAQEKTDHHKHHQYKLIDLGTFGGPAVSFRVLAGEHQLSRDRHRAGGYNHSRSVLSELLSAIAW